MIDESKVKDFIFCRLCKDYFINSRTVKCGHTFCSFCLDEYFLFTSTCPECMQQVRNGEIRLNIILDKLVVEYLKKFNQQEYQNYLKRLQIQKQYKKQRVVMNIAAGDKIDVKDNKNIWRVARVMRTHMKASTGRIKFVKFNFLDSKIEDQLPQNSHRIAPLGFFTDRSEIPKDINGIKAIKNTDQYYLYEER